MDKKFIKEDKYLVIKRENIANLHFSDITDKDQQCVITFKDKVPETEYFYVVVSEKDKDLYDYVWSMIEAGWLQDNGEYNKAVLLRARIELLELNKKIDGLNHFIHIGRKFYDLNPPTQLRLKEQLAAMKSYSRILHDRIHADLAFLDLVDKPDNSGNGQAPK